MIYFIILYCNSVLTIGVSGILSVLGWNLHTRKFWNESVREWYNWKNTYRIVDDVGNFCFLYQPHVKLNFNNNLIFRLDVKAIVRGFANAICIAYP